MSNVSQEDMDILREEMLYDNKIAELETKSHEDDMRTDADYFCEWVLDNLTKVGNIHNPTSLRDMIELLNDTIKEYGQDIDEVYNFMKEI